MDTNAGPAWVQVESVAVAAVAYDRASRTLFVRFREGAAYAYLDAPEVVFDAFLRAPSKGRFFQEEVGPVFRYVRLD